MAFSVFLWTSLGLASGVEVHGSSECIEPRAAEAALGELVEKLRPHAEASLTVRAAVSLVGDDVDASLKLINESGQPLLERRYKLTRADCPELQELYVLVVGEFLRELPAEDWRKIVEPESPPLPAWRVGLEGALEMAHGAGVPSGGIGLWSDLGDGSQRFMTVLWAESTVWKTLGEGEYHIETGLAGAGWRYITGNWSGEVLLMGGLGRISGRGYEDNQAAWVPWVELVGAGGVSIGSVRLGGRLTVLPIRHEVSTYESGQLEATPALELGLSIQVPL